MKIIVHKGCFFFFKFPRSLICMGPQSDRLTSFFILPLLRLWIMAIIDECLLSSSSFCFSFVSSWLFCSSRDDAWKTGKVKKGSELQMSTACLFALCSLLFVTLMLASFLACSVLLSSFLKTSTVSSRSLFSWSFSFTFSSSARSSPRRPDGNEAKHLLKQIRVECRDFSPKSAPVSWEKYLQGPRIFSTT